MNILSKICVVGAVFTVTGCVYNPAQIAESSFPPVYPEVKAEPKVSTGSLFMDGYGDSLFGHQKNYQVGDILTVLLDEQTQATRLQHTTTARVSSNDALTSIQSGLSKAATTGMPFGLGKGVGSAIAQAKMDGSTTKSDGTGDHGQRATLAGSLSVTVIEVMTNGNLVVRGEKQLALSEGTEVIKVSGVIRNSDIAANGTVLSRRLANAQFSYRGSGDLANATQPGWGTRALYKFWPF